MHIKIVHIFLENKIVDLS